MQGETSTGAVASGVDAANGLGGESRRAVYRDLLRFGPRSRRDLITRLGLSAPTVSRVTRELLEAGHLRPLEAVAQAKGRPQEPLDIQEAHGPRFVGVKVTADEIHAVVTTVRGNLLEELTLPLPSTAPEAVERALVPPVQALVEAHPHVAGIGVSLGARVAGRRRVIASTLLGWSEPHDLADRLEAQLGLPVVVENDLAAMVHGLHWFGIGRSYRSYVVLTIGAGVGLATVLEGRLVEGRSHLAGLTERIPVGTGPDGAPVVLADLANLGAVLRRAGEQGILRAGDGLPQLREKLAAADPGALELSAELAQAVARAVATAVALLDPEAIVLGGEALDLVRAADPVLEDTLAEMVHPAQHDLPVRDLSGDFDEWARGAAVIAIQEYVGAPA